MAVPSLFRVPLVGYTSRLLTVLLLKLQALWDLDLASAMPQWQLLVHDYNALLGLLVKHVLGKTTPLGRVYVPTQAELTREGFTTVSVNDVQDAIVMQWFTHLYPSRTHAHFQDEWNQLAVRFTPVFMEFMSIVKVYTLGAPVPTHGAPQWLIAAKYTPVAPPGPPITRHVTTA